MRGRTLLTTWTLVAFALLAFAVAARVEAQAPGYVGSEKCAQCHGAKYESYIQTWHARVLRVLSRISRCSRV